MVIVRRSTTYNYVPPPCGGGTCFSCRSCRRRRSHLSALSSLLNGQILAKLTQIYHWEGKMLIRFWWPWPHFKGHKRAKIIGKRGVASCTHSISLLNRQILAKLTQIYYWEMEICWLDFGDLDPFFKVTGGLRLLENGLSASYLLKEWIDYNQTWTSILLGHVNELIRFWWPWLHFQGHRRA